MKAASGQSIAGYRVIEPLGQGGFARVYRAEHCHTRRIVALKVLHFGAVAVADDAQRERHRSRFLRETALCADLHHPHIVGLIDRGQTEDGELFAAYEFVPGETLASHLRRRGSLPAPEAGELMGQVLDALACAHAAGVVHRDLKPENIMVTQTGSRPHAVVLDFGIGALTEEARRDGYRDLTLTREAVGTPRYAAPEQLRGGAPPTPKADIYAWALVFLECLTGEYAVSGASPAEVVSHQLDPSEVPLPGGLASTPLGALLRRALRKRVAERAADAASLHTELRQLNLGAVVGLVGGKGTDGAPAGVRGVTAEAENPIVDCWLGGERRQVTVLCCSVDAEHPAMSAAEQERLEATQRNALAEIRDVVERFGGWVAGSLAGRMLVYFAYPRARDDSARQAAHAALEALARLSAGEVGAGVEPRFTLHTGPVIIREDGPSDGVTQAAVMRLASSTPAFGVGATPSTARLLERDAEIALSEPSGEPERDGLILLEARTEGQAPRRNAQSLVGRERDLETLERAFRADSKGTTVALISGEGGVGKSSLVDAFATRIREQGGSVHVARCHSEEQNSALWPMLELLRRTWGLPGADGDLGITVLEQKLAELGFEPPDVVPVLTSWLGLPTPADLPARRESPDRQKALLFAVLARALAEANGQPPGLLVLEDVHWADPTTLEFLGSVVERTHRHRMLLITTRGAGAAPLRSEGVIHLALGGLPPAQVDELARCVLDAPLSTAAAQQISDRTGGVPWFVLELVRTLKEKQLLVREGPAFGLRCPLDAPAVPATLHDVLTARLDRLGPVRETAMLAAALGRTFSARMLALVSDKPATEIEADLRHMSDREVVIADARHDEALPHYAFRHSLLREVAYEALLPSARVRVHARVANVLERDFPELVRADPALFARHLAAARRFAEAVSHGTRAAEAALSRAANAEARAQAESVLEWISSIPESDRVNAQLRAQGVLTQALMATKGWADSEVKACVDASTRLLERQPDPELEVRTRWALMTFHYVASQRAELGRLAREFSELADRRGDRSLQIAARTFVSLVAHGSGHYRDADRGLSGARDLYDRELDREHGRAFGLDAWAWSTATLALVRWFRGDTESAHRLTEEAIAWAREIDHMPSLGIALLYAANLHHYAGNKARVEALANELLALDERYGFPAYRAYASVLGAWAAGDRTAGPVIVGQLRGMGCTAALSYYASLAGESAAEQGDHRGAVEQFSVCLELCTAYDEHYYEAQLHYLRACSLLELDERAAALEELECARRLSREQGASWVEEHAERKAQPFLPSSAASSAVIAAHNEGGPHGNQRNDALSDRLPEGDRSRLERTSRLRADDQGG